MLRRRFSTSILADRQFVPWLAAAGELAYAPHTPPERDYYFQSLLSKINTGFVRNGRRTGM